MRERRGAATGLRERQEENSPGDGENGRRAVGGALALEKVRETDCQSVRASFAQSERVWERRRHAAHSEGNATNEINTFWW